jgi:hypothetical protein
VKDVALFALLTDDIMLLFHELEPTADEQLRWEEARLIVSEAAGKDLTLFGSARSMFAVRGTADIDLCWVEPSSRDVAGVSTHVLACVYMCVCACMCKYAVMCCVCVYVYVCPLENMIIHECYVI